MKWGNGRSINCRSSWSRDWSLRSTKQPLSLIPLCTPSVLACPAAGFYSFFEGKRSIALLDLSFLDLILCLFVWLIVICYLKSYLISNIPLPVFLYYAFRWSDLFVYLCYHILYVFYCCFDAHIDCNWFIRFIECIYFS